MKDFINKHRILAAFIAVLVASILIFLLYSVTTNKTSIVGPIDKDFQTGDDDTSELIYLQNSLYTVLQDDKDLKHINITAFSGYRNTAVNQLYDIQQNPADYKITFNYENPFKKYE